MSLPTQKKKRLGDAKKTRAKKKKLLLENAKKCGDVRDMFSKVPNGMNLLFLFFICFCI